jgi:CheY-like chemotaxis protein
VIKASSGVDALSILRTDKPIDLLITDYCDGLAMTGLQLASKRARSGRKLPILLATGYADLPSGKVMELPRLSKPYQQRELAEQISTVVGLVGGARFLGRGRMARNILSLNRSD